MGKVTITKKDIDKLSKLANLQISDEESNTYPEQLTESLQYVENMQQLDTEDVSDIAYTIDLKNVMREDEIDESQRLTQEEALSNSDNTKDGKFVVKRIL